MYKVQPSDAMTELYSGRQELDFSPIERAFTQKSAQENEDRRDKVAKEEYNEERALTGMKIDDSKIFERDQPLFAELRDKFYAQTKADISKLRSGDADAWIRYNQSLGEISQKAQLSKEAKDYFTKINMQGTDGMDYEDMTGLYKWAQDDVGNFDKPNVNKRVDLVSEVGKLAAIAKKSSSDKGLGNYVSKEEADQLLDEALQNKPFARQAVREFDKATDEDLSRLGLSRDKSTAADYIKAQYSDNIAFEDKNKQNTGSGSGSSSKKGVTLNVTTHGDGSKTAEIFLNGKQSTAQNIQDPNNPNRGMKVIPLTYEKSKDGKIKLKALNVDTNKIEELDYDKVQSQLFRGYDIENPYDIFNKPETVSKINKEQNVTPKGGASKPKEDLRKKYNY